MILILDILQLGRTFHSKFPYFSKEDWEGKCEAVRNYYCDLFNGIFQGKVLNDQGGDKLRIYMEALDQFYITLRTNCLDDLKLQSMAVVRKKLQF